MSAERDLGALLRGMRPEWNEGRFVFCTLPGETAVPEGLHPVATVLEPEGITLVLPQDTADAAGLRYDYVAGWITLRVHSALDAVGLTGAFAAELAAHGLSCNVIAGFHHDHLFVPEERAAEAVAVLEALAARSA
ncbi:ACT domain-containing protein [Streptomyces antimicrobicus]|uniref:ACT domain-containing protein n=1 Tax=Streptomyces antimicrobicus TaxID=2883108 RepID=A0ABS8BDC1_9ACTN|nr:ACT domain-containing protein [Streptomyces antimicrobicus]MCB5182506.1 ACT domain-containing protein [Streptomyces antimicrobicus]